MIFTFPFWKTSLKLRRIKLRVSFSARFWSSDSTTIITEMIASYIFLAGPATWTAWKRCFNQLYMTTIPRAQLCIEAFWQDLSYFGSKNLYYILLQIVKTEISMRRKHASSLQILANSRTDNTFFGNLSRLMDAESADSSVWCWWRNHFSRLRRFVEDWPLKRRTTTDWVFKFLQINLTVHVAIHQVKAYSATTYWIMISSLNFLPCRKTSRPTTNYSLKRWLGYSSCAAQSSLAGKMSFIAALTNVE